MKQWCKAKHSKTRGLGDRTHSRARVGKGRPVLKAARGPSQLDQEGGSSGGESGVVGAPRKNNQGGKTKNKPERN